MKKLDTVQPKELTDQIRTSITQGVLQVVGPDNLVKITDASITIDTLEPVGKHLTIKLSVDIYPDERKKP